MRCFRIGLDRTTTYWVAGAALCFCVNVDGAHAEYRICRSQIDGREYVACPPNSCFRGDSTIGYNPGNHGSCSSGSGATGPSCGRHWSGWQNSGKRADNPCPPGCQKSRHTRDDSRLVDFLKPQYREEWECVGTPLPRAPSSSTPTCRKCDGYSPTQDRLNRRGI